MVEWGHGGGGIGFSAGRGSGSLIGQELDGSLHIEAAQEASATINRMAFEAGITLASISIVLPTLEETFFEMTGDDK